MERPLREEGQARPRRISYRDRRRLGRWQKTDKGVSGGVWSVARAGGAPGAACGDCRGAGFRGPAQPARPRGLFFFCFGAATSRGRRPRSKYGGSFAGGQSATPKFLRQTTTTVRRGCGCPGWGDEDGGVSGLYGAALAKGRADRAGGGAGAGGGERGGERCSGSGGTGGAGQEADSGLGCVRKARGARVRFLMEASGTGPGRAVVLIWRGADRAAKED